MSTPRYGREFVAAALRRAAVADEDGNLVMEFRAVNGRWFVVREEEVGRYFAFEFIPNGRLAIQRESGAFSYSSWPGHDAAARDPNAYVELAEKDGIDPKDLVLCGAGYGVFTRYLGSVEEAAAEFVRCLRENERYDDIDRAKMADPDFRENLRKQEEEMRRQYREETAAAHEAAVEREHGIFKGLHGMMGPLSDGAKQRILSFLNAPSVETWGDCASLMIKGSTTMWNAWVSADPNAPRSLDVAGVWPTYPDPEAMREILRQVGGACEAAASFEHADGSRFRR